jgi:hypothetical protein
MFHHGPGDPNQTPRPKKRKQWVHLLWAEPLALPLAAALFVLGSITRCGLGQCNGGGFGHKPSEPVQSALFFFGSAFALAFPLAIVPWARRRIRFSVAAGIAALWFAYCWTQVR